MKQKISRQKLSSSILMDKTGAKLLIRDFKIGHYGRLGRLDAYTGGLGP